MSQSLVRRGLDLYKDDLKDSQTKITMKTKVSEDEITKLVGTNKKGFKRKIKRMQTKQNMATLKEKRVKSSEGLFETYTKRDKTADNVKALNFLRLLNTDEKRVMEQAAERHEQKTAKKKYKKNETESKPAEETSVFTEKDFEQFFKEYNFT